MIYELKSKLTGKVSVVDQETYDKLLSSKAIKKYNILKTHKPAKVPIPDEIIQRSKINKLVKND